jgi:hypothetical protein
VTRSIPSLIGCSANSVTAREVADTYHTLLVRRSGRIGCGVRAHTFPDAFATSIARSSGISSGLHPHFACPPTESTHLPTAGLPAGTVEGTESLTGVSKPRHPVYRRTTSTE